MSKQTIDRITEILVVLCVAAALVVLSGRSRVPDDKGFLAGLRVQEVGDQDLERFRALIREVRRKVDSNIEPGQTMIQLKKDYPGRHEVWAVSARHEESVGRDGPAVVSYARAVRLEPDYLDENSILYLGRRIEGIVDRIMEDLLEARDNGLDEEGKVQLKAAYFLKRRLAGGCE